MLIRFWTEVWFKTEFKTWFKWKDKSHPMLPGPSFILIHPTVHRIHRSASTPTLQKDRQRSDSIGRTVLQTVAPKINWVKCGFSSAATSAFYLFKIRTSADPHFTPGPGIFTLAGLGLVIGLE